MSVNIDDYIDYEAHYLAHVAKAKVTGDQVNGLCPFHEDHQSSFGAELKTGKWKCRAGCGEGNITSFHARLNQMDNPEAYRDLCRIYNVPAQGKDAPKDEKIIPPDILKLFQPLPDFVEQYLIEKRGWSSEVIKKYHIGYNAKRIFKPGNVGEQRITIPVFDSRGNLVNIRTYKPKAQEYKLVSWSTGSKKKGNWVGYGESRLFPVENIETARRSEDKVIILTEGEPDDLCGISHGLNCITQTAGAETWKDSFNALFRDLRVIVAYDNDDAGLKGAQRVGRHLPAFAASVERIIWPEWMGEKEDLTDWFMKHGKTAAEFLALPREKLEADKSQSSSTSATADEAIQQLNQKHAVIMIGGKCLVMNEIFDPVFGRPDITLSSIGDLKNYYSNAKIWTANGDGKRRLQDITKLWMDSPDRRQYEGITFSPGQEVEGRYNLWKGFPVDPKKGDWSLINRHIWEVIADKNREIYEWLICWLADIAQNPGGEKPGTSLVLRGERGTGKGCFVYPLSLIFGNHFLHITHQNQLVGRFNSHLKNALLVFADECFWAGDKLSEGILKGMITEPYIMIEPKGKDVFAVKNHVRLIVASNEEWVVPAGLEERRFLVLDVSAKHMQDTKYFKPIFEQITHGGAEAMLYDLLRVDLSGVDLRKAPKTEGLLDQIENSMDSVTKFWFERLHEGSLLKEHDKWHETVYTDAFYAQYIESATRIGKRHLLGKIGFVKKLKKLCPLLVRKFVLSEGAGSYGRREWAYQIPDLETCRDALSKRAGIRIEWGKYDDTK